MGISNFLLNYHYYFILGLFISFVFLIIYNRKKIVQCFSPIGKNTWMLVILILLIGVLVRYFYSPHFHQVFNDELFHLNIAENLLTQQKFCFCKYGFEGECTRCFFPGWPPGFHVLLSIFWSLFGVSETSSYIFNICLSSLSLLGVFLLAYVVFHNEKIALLAMLLLTFLPVHLKISASTALEPASFLFIILTVTIAFIYFRTREDSLAFLLLSAMVFTLYIRPENFLIPLGIAILFLDGKLINFLKRRYMYVFFFMSLAIPHFFQLLRNFWFKTLFWNESLESPMHYLIHNGKANILFWFDNEINPLLYTLFAIIGFIFLFQKNRKTAYFSLVWFIIFGVFYSCFQRGNLTQEQYQDAYRYSLALYIPVILCGAYGIFYFINKFHDSFMKSSMYIMLLLFLSSNLFFFYGFIHKEYRLQKVYRHLLSIKDEVPKECIVIAKDVNFCMHARYALEMPSVTLSLYHFYKSRNKINDRDKCFIVIKDEFADEIILKLKAINQTFIEHDAFYTIQPKQLHKFLKPDFFKDI